MSAEELNDLPDRPGRGGRGSPVPIVVALIKRPLPPQSPGEAQDVQDHFLLIRRNGSPYYGKWALVGGKWEFGETLAAALVREIREETTLAATFVALRGVVSERVWPPAADAREAHFLIFVCEAAAPDGRAQEQREGETAWFTPAQIEGLHRDGAIIPSDYAMLHSFTATAVSAPLYEAEMRASLDATADHAIELLRFDEAA